MNKGIIYTIIISLSVLYCCSSSKPVSQNDNNTGIEITDTSKQDTTEYELIVLDPGFDSYLASLPYSKDFYSNSYYRNWIIQYVNEWNIRQANPLRYGDFYETPIAYDPNVDYGIDLNFKLYHYFLFIEKEYGIHLIRRRY